MIEQDYWFAQRIAPGPKPARRGVAPVSCKGWVSIAVMAAPMLAGALAFGFFSIADRTLQGVALYALSVLIGAGQFVYFIAAKTDPSRTGADYRAMKQDNSLNDKLGGRR
jgi:hypothetical protein